VDGTRVIGVVITFDDTENKTWVTVSETDLERFIGHDAVFQFSKTKDFKGKVVAVETDFLVVEFEEAPMGLGQGSQVSVAE
jgi:ribosome maturation factor RimP